jgi:hypothetical protein
MKKSLFAAVVVGSFLFVGTGAALATPIVDTWPGPKLLDPPNSTLSYTHNILDNGFVVGETLTLASLLITLTFTDGAPPEKYDLSFDGTPIADNLNLLTPTLAFNDVSSYLGDGELNVVFKQRAGSITFIKSELTAGWSAIDSEVNSSDVTSTPEPASMLLLGSGLVGLAGIVRNRKKKQI